MVEMEGAGKLYSQCTYLEFMLDGQGAGSIYATSAPLRYQLDFIKLFSWFLDVAALNIGFVAFHEYGPR